MLKARLLQALFLPSLILAGGTHPCSGIQASQEPRPLVGEWSVSPIPETTIGVVDGPDELVLLGVRDATALSDGTIVVGMFTRNFFEIRYFDTGGAFIGAAGRWGEGPFETRSGFTSFERLGDSVLVVSLDRRYSVFGPSGEGVRSGRLSLQGLSYPSNLLDDRHLGLWAQTFPGTDTEPSRISFFIHDLGSELTDSVCTLPNARSVIASDGLFLHLPFEPITYWAAGGGRFWVGNSGGGEVLGYSADSDGPERIVLDLSPQEVSRQDQRSWKEFDLRGASGAVRQGYEAHHKRVAFPDTFPFFQGLMVDRVGNLWVLRYRPPWSTEDYLWDVFTSEGKRVAVTSIPFDVLPATDRTRPLTTLRPILEIGADYILIRHTDELGVEKVRRHSLNKEPKGLLVS